MLICSYFLMVTAWFQELAANTHLPTVLWTFAKMTTLHWMEWMIFMWVQTQPPICRSAQTRSTPMWTLPETLWLQSECYVELCSVLLCRDAVWSLRACDNNSKLMMFSSHCVMCTIKFVCSLITSILLTIIIFYYPTQSIQQQGVLFWLSVPVGQVQAELLLSQLALRHQHHDDRSELERLLRRRRLCRARS